MPLLTSTRSLRSPQKSGLLSTLALASLSALALISTGWAQSAPRPGDLEPDQVRQGESVQVTMRGGNLGDDLVISFSNPSVRVTSGLSYTPSAEIADGEGDKLIFSVNAEQGAELGLCNMIVSREGLPAVEKFDALTVLEGIAGGTPTPGGGGDSNPDDDPTPGVDEDDPRYRGLPPRVPGTVNAITYASPPIGEQGGQVNLWIEGREFPNNPEIKFSTNEIGPAYSSGEVLDIRVDQNTASSNGNIDGINYRIRISPSAPRGPVTITVTDPTTRSEYTTSLDDRLFEIVARGEGMNLNQQGAEDIEAVTGASPLAVRAGYDSAMWVYGMGFNIRSLVQYSTSTITEKRPSEPVIQAQNMPGFDGIRSYLSIPANTPPGPVDITVENPNGSSATKMAAFQVHPPSDREGLQPGADIPACDEDDSNLFVVFVGQLTPNLLAQGEEVEVSLAGAGFGCRPDVLISGLGGVEMTRPAYRTVDPNNPSRHYLNFTLRIAPNAPLGPRSITIYNPNGSEESNPQAFTVVSGGDAGGAACSTIKQRGGAWALLLLALLSGLSVIRRRLSQA